MAKRPVMRTALNWALALTLALTLAGAAKAATWYVRPGGDGSGMSWTDALGSVQAAINSATASDEIWVASGTYNEAITMKSGIALYGGFSATETVRDQRDWVANETVLDASGKTERALSANEISRTVIDGLTITNSGPNTEEYYPERGGITLNGVASASIQNCRIFGHVAVIGAGVYCEDASATFINCAISDNLTQAFQGGGAGLYISHCSPTLIQCIISGNFAAGGGGGIYCVESSPKLRHCSIIDNYASSMYYPVRGGGIYCLDSSPMLTDCTVLGNSFDGFYFNGPSWPIIADCTVENNSGPGVSCYYGASPHLTNCTITSNFGGGVDSSYASSPSLSDCRISQNTAAFGGGIYISESSAALTNCAITGNIATVDGGGVYCYASSPTFTNCVIEGNQTDHHFGSGGGILCDRSSPTLTGCVIRSNTATFYGGGVSSGWSSSAVLIRCLISENFAFEGGGIDCGSSDVLINCAISGNRAGIGGAVYSYGSSAMFTNCTITNNRAELGGGGMSCESSPVPNFTNSILWNEGEELRGGSSFPQITYSAVEGGYPGLGNIDADPLFVDAANSDFRLSAGSPCIDAGTRVEVYDDLDGNPRPVDVLGRGHAGADAYDIGCYEFQLPSGDLSGDGFYDPLDLFIFQRDWMKDMGVGSPGFPLSRE